MISCPYCEQQWITIHQLTCTDCDPKLKADMTLSDLMEVIENLNDITHFNKKRIHLIDKAIVQLSLIKNKFENA